MSWQTRSEDGYVLFCTRSGQAISRNARGSSAPVFTQGLARRGSFAAKPLLSASLSDHRAKGQKRNAQRKRVIFQHN